MEVKQIFDEFWTNYSKTPQLLRIIDVFLGYILLTGIIQFVYCALVGTFPFNSFLSGFISTVGSFILTVCLRIQIGPRSPFKITKQKAFFDYLLANFILHLWVMNFMG
eukprot:TRINITY_DN1515_c0_g1_i2.p1 TRINITY_DN1515_c0_g1~~TRINITY_DN1515_c0_g1_i2.p1  ORF type:complete len:108 (-),score=31.26 TRINITY_DN1515_c0_g1_i2:68-391(-)